MNQPQDNSAKGQPGTALAALSGLCPDCGARTLFAGPVKFADRCPSCGLNFASYNVGDGPAALLTMIVGALIVALALGLDSAVRPPFWVHIILWVPITALAVTWSLRVCKGALLILEHRNQAHEGRLAKPDEDLPE